jgi:nucleotide-binding universal stress UspA family protein
VPVAAHGASGVVPHVDPVTIDAFRDRARQVAEEALATVQRLQPSVEAEALEAWGQAAHVLLDQGADADLIVVGKRGLGGFKSLLLGSVSQQVVQHAACPVVVVN